MEAVVCVEYRLSSKSKESRSRSIRSSYAESPDGREWSRPNITCIEYTFEGEANARPCVIKENGQYRMWYCHRGSIDYRTDKSQSYRLGYAESRRRGSLAASRSSRRHRSLGGWDGTR